MGGSKKRKVLAVFLIIGIVVNLLPHLMNMVFALNREKLIQNIQLVSTTTMGDPRTSYTVLQTGDSYNQLDHKYYIKIDWDDSNIIGKIEPGDTFTVEVKGLLLEDSASGYDIQPVNNSNPSISLPVIGKITVENNIITATFNNNVNSAPISSLSDLGGSMFVRTTVDVNQFVGGNVEFTTSFYANKTLRTALTLKHDDLTPWYTILRKGASQPDVDYAEKATNLLPGESVTSKLTIYPKQGYIITKFMLSYTFNDYVFTYFADNAGRGLSKPSHPIFNGDDTFNYEFNQIETTHHRTDNITTQEALETKGLWEFKPEFDTSKPGHLSEFGEPATLLYNYFFDPLYDRELQDQGFDEDIDLEALYKVIKIDEVYNESHAGGRTDTTFVTVKYVYQEGSNQQQVIPDKVYSNIALNNTTFLDYKISTDEINDIQNAGYQYKDTTSLSSLDPDGSKNIVYVYCTKKPGPTPPPTGLTSVTVKYVYKDGNTLVTVIPEKVYSNVPLNDTTYSDYKISTDEINDIQNAGYQYKDTTSLSSLDPDGSKNIVYVYCSKKPDPTVLTSVTIKYIYNDGNTQVTVIPDKIYSDVPLNDTTYLNYKLGTQELKDIEAANYVYKDTVQLSSLSPDGSQNIIYVYCDKKSGPTPPPTGLTSVTVKYVYKDGNTQVTVIPDKFYPSVSLNDTTFLNYKLGTDELKDIEAANYVYKDTIQLSSLSPDGSQNIIYVYCDKKSGPTPSPTPTVMTSVTVKYVYKDGNTQVTVIPDKIYSNVSLNDTAYLNYKLGTDELNAIQAANYVYKDTIQLSSLSPDGSQNIIYVYCEKKSDPGPSPTPTGMTSVTVKYVYNDGTKLVTVIPDKFYPSVSLNDTTYLNYKLGTDELNAIQAANYVYKDTKQLTVLDPDGSKNIIYVYCEKKSDPGPSPTPTTTTSPSPVPPTKTTSSGGGGGGGSIYVPTTSASPTPSQSPTPSVTGTYTAMPSVTSSYTATPSTTTPPSSATPTPTPTTTTYNPSETISPSPSTTDNNGGKENPDTADTNFMKFGTVMAGGFVLMVMNRKKMTTKNK